MHRKNLKVFAFLHLKAVLRKGRTLVGNAGKEDIIRFDSNWLNIEDCLSIISIKDRLAVYRPAKRRIGIRCKPEGGGSLYVDEICSPCEIGLRDYEETSVLPDTGFIIQCEVSHEETDSFVTSNKYSMFNEHEYSEIRSTIVEGADCVKYPIIASFAKNDTRFILNPGSYNYFINLVGNYKVFPDSQGNFSFQCEKENTNLYAGVH